VASLTEDLFRRRVPYIVGGYLGASWAFLQVSEYLVLTFLLSPHWNRVALTLVLLLVPSVLMVAYFHGTPGKDRWQVIEKVGIPINVAVAFVVLMLAFGDSDLGASTTIITVQNEDGDTVERVVAKPEFRRRTALFTFDAGDGIGEDRAWITYAAASGLWMDLAQDDFIEPLPDALMQQELWGAGHQSFRDVPLSLKRELASDHHADHFVAGEIRMTGESYGLLVQVHDTESGRLVEEHVYGGPAILPLLDSASIDIKADLEIPSRDDVEDLPLTDRLTAQSGVLEDFGRGLEALLVRNDWAAAVAHLSAAVASEPSFARAQHMLATALLAANRGPQAAGPIRTALENIHRLPERLQFVVKSDYYFLTQDYDRAWAVVEMWAELHPEDYFALLNLLMLQSMRGDHEGMLATLGTQYRLNENNRDILRQMAEVYQELGRQAEAGTVLEEYTQTYPDDYSGFQSLASHLLLEGEFEQAREQLDRALLLEPGRASLLANLGQLELRTGRFEEARAELDRAMDAAGSPQDRVGVLASIRTYHDYRGESGAAIDAMIQRLEVGASFMPVFLLAPNASDIEMYFEAGRGEEGVAHFERTGGRIQPPFDAFARPGQFQIALELGNAEEARTILERAEGEFAALGYQGGLEDQLSGMRGRLAEAEGDMAAALETYRSRLTLNRGNSSTVSTVHRDIGRVLLAMGRLEEAEAETRETLRLWPSSGWAHLQMAQILMERGDRSATVEHLESALGTWGTADPTYQPAQEARELLGQARS